MYQVGDVVMYSYSGVCEVKEIRKMSFGKAPKKNYLILVPVYDNKNTVYVPVDQAQNALRPPLKKEEIDDLISKIPEMKSIWIDDMKRRKDAYTAILQKGDPVDLIHLIRTVYDKDIERKQIGKRVSEADQRQLAIAEKVLHGEMAFGLGIDISEVSDYIENKLK